MTAAEFIRITERIWRIYNVYNSGANITKGIMIGAAAGAAATVIASRLMVRDKRQLKRSARKAMHTVGTLVDDVGCIFKG